jgi:outer membrane lipoprotein carrier protein
MEEQVQDFYDRSESLNANFRQESIRARTGRKKVRSGRIRVQRPGKIRWDYVQPTPIHYVSDGSVLWVYQPRDALAYKMPLGSNGLDEAIRFLSGSVRLAQTFKIEEIPQPKSSVVAGLKYLKLVPKKASASVRSLVLGAQPDDGAVVFSILTDPDGNQIRTYYTKLDFGKSDDRVFRFVPPRGVRVEDLSRGLRTPESVKPVAPR